MEPQPILAGPSWTLAQAGPTSSSSREPSPAEYQRGFHEMVMLFQLMVEHDHETFWLFQFFLQKTVRTKQGSNLLLPTTLQAQGTDSLRHFLQPPNTL